MKSFESFLKSFDVVRARQNMPLARDLVEQAQTRFDYFCKLPFDVQSCTFVLEGLYESIRQLLDAHLAAEGYKSYSHEAAISFAWEKRILNHKESIILDQLRVRRNKTHYDGVLMTLGYAQQARPEAIAIFKKIQKNLE